MVEERDQWRLAAKIQLQRFLFSAGGNLCRRHLTKAIDVSSAKTVDRLLPIADDEQIRRPPTLREGEAFEQNSLHLVCILKLVDEEKPVALRRSRDHFGPLKQRKRSQLEIVKVER
jgi:hypothetical protein